MTTNCLPVVGTWMPSRHGDIRAANHNVLVVVYYARGHHTTLLRLWSYCDTLPWKKKRFIFDLVHACGHQMCQQKAARVPFFVSVVLVVPQPVGVRVLNQLTNCSVRFNSCSFASLPGEMTHVFNHFKSLCWSEKQKTSSRVISQQKKIFQEEYIYRKVSVPCTVNAEHPAC